MTENTKTDGIGSGLVAVAWMDYNVNQVDSEMLSFIEAKPSEEDYADGFRCDALVRRSDAEERIADLNSLVTAENQRKQQLEALIAEKDAALLALRLVEKNKHQIVVEQAERIAILEAENERLRTRVAQFDHGITRIGLSLDVTCGGVDTEEAFGLGGHSASAIVEAIEKLKAERGESQYCASCNELAKENERLRKSITASPLVRITNGADGVFAHVVALNGDHRGINLEHLACNSDDEWNLVGRFFRALVDRVVAETGPFSDTAMQEGKK